MAIMMKAEEWRRQMEEDIRNLSEQKKKRGIEEIYRS